MLECVVNISEGRRLPVLDELARACGAPLLDRHADPDHHRSVFTLGHADDLRTEAAARALAQAAAERLSIADHDGVHPRLGVIDVVPFVALRPTPTSVAVGAAQRFAGWLGDELGVPSFFYDAADDAGRSLPEVRRDAFARRAPDRGPSTPHPALGATAVGARPPLVAVNVELDRDDVALAKTVARAVRERDGGLPGVRALGLALARRGRSQVSMNLVRLDETGVEAACTAVRAALGREGCGVEAVELVGLIPSSELARCSPEFLAWSGLSEDVTIEARVARAGGAGGGATPAGAGPSPA